MSLKFTAIYFDCNNNEDFEFSAKTFLIRMEIILPN